MTSPIDGKIVPFGQVVDAVRDFLHAPAGDVPTEAGALPNLHKLAAELRAKTDDLSDVVLDLGNLAEGGFLEPQAAWAPVRGLVNDKPGATDPLNAQAHNLLNRIEALRDSTGQPIQDDIALGAYQGDAKVLRFTGVLGTAAPTGFEGPIYRNDAGTTPAELLGITCFRDGKNRVWERPQTEVIPAEWAGAKGDGFTNDRNAIQRALLTRKNVCLTQGRWYKVPSQFDLFVRLQALIGNGALIDAFGLAEDQALVYFNAARADSLPTDYQPTQVFGLHNVRLLGPGKGGAGASYESTTVGVAAHAPHTRMVGVNIYGFGTGVSLYTASYIQNWDSCAIGQCAIGVHNKPSGSDYGERIVFSKSLVYDCKLGVKNECPTGGLQFDHCSIDYNLKTLDGSNSSITELHGVWLECNDAGAGKVHVELSGMAQFLMIGGRIQQNGVPGALAQDAFFKFSPAERVNLSQVFMFNTQNVADVLCTGGGEAEIDHILSYEYAYIPTRLSANQLADGGFDLSEVADDWELISDTQPITNPLTGENTQITLSTDSPHSGTQCLKVNKLAGGAPGSIRMATRIRPRARAAISLWFRKPAVANSGAPIYLTFAAFRVKGRHPDGRLKVVKQETFDTLILSQTNDAVAWTRFITSLTRRMPAWVTHAGPIVNLDSFQGNCAFDDVYIGTDRT